MSCRRIHVLTLSLLFALAARGENNHRDAYTLVWEDNFDMPSLNETEWWNIEVNGDGGGNHELQYYCRNNVSVGEDKNSGERCLILTARKENHNGKTATSGRVNTRHKITTRYGKIEARIKLPDTADGLWPAFWLLGDDITHVGWPRCGEIDVLEMGHADGIKNGTQATLFNGACHWGVSYKNVQHNAQSAISSYSLQDGKFHLYTLEWDRDSIKMYLDKDVYPDVLPYYTIDITHVSSPDSCGNFFHKPFFIVFNLAVGGDYPDIHNIEAVTALSHGEANMYVDFVRIYRKNDVEITMNNR